MLSLSVKLPHLVSCNSVSLLNSGRGMVTQRGNLLIKRPPLEEDRFIFDQAQPAEASSSTQNEESGFCPPSKRDFSEMILATDNYHTGK